MHIHTRLSPSLCLWVDRRRGLIGKGKCTSQPLRQQHLKKAAQNKT